MIRRLPDGRWRLRYYADGSKAGRRRQETLPASLSRAEAQAEATKRTAAAALRRLRPVADATVADLAARWLEIHAVKLSDGWRRRAERVLEERLLPALGGQQAASLRIVDVEAYRRARLDQGAAPGTVNRELTILRSILSRAVTWQLLERHPLPTRALPALREPQGRLVWFTADEWTRFRAAFSDLASWRVELARVRRFGPRTGAGKRPDGAAADQLLRTYRETALPVFEALLLTGSRLVEITGLRWEDVDLAAGRLRIPQPKTHDAKELPIGTALRGLLEARRRSPGQPLVFPTATGSAWQPRRLQLVWDRFRRLAGLRPELTIHVLRHTAASWLVQAGEPLAAVARVLGHRSIRTTMRYAHLAPDHLASAVEILGTQSGIVGAANGGAGSGAVLPNPEESRGSVRSATIAVTRAGSSKSSRISKIR